MKDKYKISEVPKDIKKMALMILNKDTAAVFYSNFDLAIVSKDEWFRLQQIKEKEKR